MVFRMLTHEEALNKVCCICLNRNSMKADRKFCLDLSWRLRYKLMWIQAILLAMAGMHGELVQNAGADSSIILQVQTLHF